MAHTPKEIAEAKQKAEEILEKRRGQSSSTPSFGGGSSSSTAVPSTITHLSDAGSKTSKQVTVRGGLNFISFSSSSSSSSAPENDSTTSPIDALKELLAALETALQTAKKTKGDVAVLFLSIRSPQDEDVESDVHQLLDTWIDPAHPPVRTVVVSKGTKAVLQLMVVTTA